MERAKKTLAVIVSEFGSEPRRNTAGETSEQWVRRVLQILQDHDWNWTAWDLHPSAGPRLISDWNYTPTPHFGVWVKQALLGTLPTYTPPSTTPPPPHSGAARANDTAMPIGLFENHP